MTAATAEKVKVPMMVGTTGYADYMAFAKNGPFALGIKPVLAVDGTQLGVPGSTWFAARMRSASSKALFEEPETSIVAFKKMPQTHEEAWPNITWEKNDKERASTTIGVMIQGAPTSKEGTLTLIDNLGNKKLATQIVDYLEKICGKENFAIERETAIAWFDEIYDEYAKKLKQVVDAQTALKEQIEAAGGQFTMHADLLKKTYKAIGQEEPQGEEKIVLSDSSGDQVEPGNDTANDPAND